MFRRLTDTNLHKCRECGNSGTNQIKISSYDRTADTSDDESNLSDSYICPGCHHYVPNKSHKSRSQILMPTDLMEQSLPSYDTYHETNLENSHPRKYTGRSHLKATVPHQAKHPDHSRTMSLEELTTSTARHTLHPKNVVLKQLVALDQRCTQSEENNQQLRQQVNSLCRVFNILEDRNQELKTQLNVLTVKNQRLQQQANNTDERCNQLVATNQNLTTQVNNLNEECKLHKAYKENSHKQISDLDRQLKNHREQLTAIWIKMNTAKEEPSLSPNIHIPTHVTDTRPPVISDIEVREETTLLNVTPAWYEPIKPPTPDQIRFPTNYDKSSPTDVRKYQCLAAYRTMMNKGQKVDFIVQPFESAVENTETVIVVLGELAHQLGARLTFTDAKFDYSDSDYRMACGVGNLGSIHSMIASGDSVQTAKVKLHLNLDYHTVTASSAVVQKFAVDIINDISIILGCKKEFIRVFSITCASSIHVEIGLTTPEYEQTTAVAEQLKQELNRLSSQKRKGVLQYLVRERYTYKWKPVLSFLQLQPSDLDPQHNRNYLQAREDRRGDRPYYQPEGWYRHALKVDNKYPGDTTWLGMTNRPGEWCVAYHGTKPGVVSDITHLGLKHQFVTIDVCESEAKQQRPSIPDVKGLYVATHCEMGAADYSDWFPAEDSSGAAKKYKVVFQCRVQNDKFTEHRSVVRIGRAFRVFDEKAIRPYGILLKSE